MGEPSQTIPILYLGGRNGTSTTCWRAPDPSRSSIISFLPPIFQSTAKSRFQCFYALSSQEPSELNTSQKCSATNLPPGVPLLSLSSGGSKPQPRELFTMPRSQLSVLHRAPPQWERLDLELWKSLKIAPHGPGLVHVLTSHDGFPNEGREIKLINFYRGPSLNVSLTLGNLECSASCP